MLQESDNRNSGLRINVIARPHRISASFFWWPVGLCVWGACTLSTWPTVTHCPSTAPSLCTQNDGEDQVRTEAPWFRGILLSKRQQQGRTGFMGHVMGKQDTPPTAGGGHQGPATGRKPRLTSQLFLNLLVDLTLNSVRSGFKCYSSSVMWLWTRPWPFIVLYANRRIKSLSYGSCKT